MKRKLVSSVLAVALLLSTSPCYATDDPPDDDPPTTIAMACFVIAIGGVVAVGLWKLCKAIPSPGDIPHPVAAPPTNPPPIINPTNSVPTNKPPWWKFWTLNVASNTIHAQNIVGYGFLDYSNRVYDQMVDYSIESSTNLRDWRTECSVTGWLSSGAAFFAYYSNGVPLVTTYSTSYNQTNYVPWDMGTGREPNKMFRLLSVH